MDWIEPPTTEWIEAFEMDYATMSWYVFIVASGPIAVVLNDNCGSNDLIQNGVSLFLAYMHRSIAQASDKQSLPLALNPVPIHNIMTEASREIARVSEYGYSI